MSEKITARDLFAAVAFNNLLPYVLAQEEHETVREAIALAAVSAWATADYMLTSDPSNSSDDGRSS